MAFVLDASIVGGWMFKDEHHSLFDIALDSLAEQTALAPAHWWFEVRNMLVLGERRRRITEAGIAAFVEWMRNLPIVIAPLPEETDVLALARKHNLTFYDAAYLELALREHVPLATLDRRIVAAAVAEDIALVSGTT